MQKRIVALLLALIFLSGCSQSNVETDFSNVSDVESANITASSESSIVELESDTNTSESNKVEEFVVPEYTAKVLPALPDEDISDRFPDEIFRRFIIERILDREPVEPYPIYGRDLDIISTITEADFWGEEERDMDKQGVIPAYKIKSMDGIEYFENIEILKCWNNELQKLDIRGNIKLKTLWCGANQISELYIGDTDVLTELLCCYNRLKWLDISGCPNLTELVCGGNPVKVFDFSHNRKLERLDCSNAPLEYLDISNNPLLVSLRCGGTGLTKLDVSSNTKLTDLQCSANELTSLDVSMLPSLDFLYCAGNWLTELDIRNNTALNHLISGCNLLDSLDVSNNPKLEWLYVGQNNIKTLDLRNNTVLHLLSTDEEVKIINPQTDFKHNYGGPYEWDKSRHPPF